MGGEEGGRLEGDGREEGGRWERDGREEVHHVKTKVPNATNITSK